MRQAAVSMWRTVSSLFPMLELLIFCKIAFFSVFQIQHLWPYLLILKHMLLQSWTSCRVIDSLLMSCTVKQLSQRRKEKSQSLLLQHQKQSWTLGLQRILTSRSLPSIPNKFTGSLKHLFLNQCQSAKQDSRLFVA